MSTHSRARVIDPRSLRRAFEREHLVEHFGETLRRLKADHPQALDLAPCAVEENDARRAEKAKAPEQLLVLGGVRSHVRLDFDDVRHAIAYLGIGERVPLHLLARDAAV